jgi:hypothetical protein
VCRMGVVLRMRLEKPWQVWHNNDPSMLKGPERRA